MMRSASVFLNFGTLIIAPTLNGIELVRWAKLSNLLMDFRGQAILYV